MSLPINRRAVHEISATLAHLNPTGETLTAGVTSIGSDRSVETPELPRSAGVRQPAAGN
jgi:hypothetical protein